MCGISAILDDGDGTETVARLLRMHAPIRHRGPDGEGALTVALDGTATRIVAPAALPRGPARVGLLFRRLRILDLSEAADQPMASPDGRQWIVFNGEIYNHRALRRELTARGRVFHTTSDTEVVLAAWEAWGEACFARLEGMWALVIVDLPGRRVVVSRDRFGIKPLYWARDGARVLFASEIRQILAACDGRPCAHAPLVAMFLRGTRLPCLEETFFDGVRAIPPATWTSLPFGGGGGAPEFRPYWTLGDARVSAPAAYLDAVVALGEVLDEAVASHMVADVPVGSLLSGGLDSSTLTVLLARRLAAGGKPCPTFSFALREASPRYCEMPYVEALTKRDGLPNHETTLDAAWVARHAGAVVRTLEEPVLAPAALAQYRVFELCRAHGVTVVFDGQGADEILAGYPYHQRLLLRDRLRPGRLSEFWHELRALRARQDRSFASLLAHYVVFDTYGTSARRALADATPAWVAAAWGRRDDTRELEIARAARGDSRLARRQYADIRWGNVKIVLGYADKSAMAHSIEARVPYLDRRVVELAFALPDVFKAGHGERKRVLRDVARPLLPREITERRDRLGFAVPDADLLAGLRPTVRQAVMDAGVADLPCMVGPAVRRFIDDVPLRDPDDVRALWRLYTLALWRTEFDVSFT